MVGSGESEGWILVWHEGKGGRLYESRFRRDDVAKVAEGLLGVLWGRQ